MSDLSEFHVLIFICNCIGMINKEIKDWILLQGPQEKKIFKFYIRYLSKVCPSISEKKENSLSRICVIFYYAVVYITNLQLINGIVR